MVGLKSFFACSILALLIWEKANAAPLNYAAALIPLELKEGANAVVRDYQYHFRVVSTANAVKRIRYVVTVFNKTADDEAKLQVSYDKLHKVKFIEGQLLDASGKQLDKLRKKDIKDQSAFGGSTLFADNRVKLASFNCNVYPYTVVWEYEVETSNMMFYPTWMPQSDQKLAVEMAELEIEVPVGFRFHYKEQLVKPAVVGKKENTETYRWEVAGLKVVEVEPNSPGLWEIVPVVQTAPSEFSVEGYAGNMDSWQSFGQWIALLNKSRNNLPPEATERIRRLTEDLVNPIDKVKAVYEYLQGNTRYVAIQLGIGGWQPFEASFVDEKKYGDCKALSFYTKAMLEAVGIPSYYTLIKAGDDRDYLDESFVRSYFNHAILCVPLEKDTVWLECTSQTNPFGFLGAWTSGRKVVLITEEGGKIARTRHYTAEENQQQTEADVYITDQNARATIKRTYSGVQFENDHLNYYIHQDKETHKKWVYRNLAIPSFDINTFALNIEKEDVVPKASLEAEINLKSLVNFSSKRMFINPNLANRYENIPKIAKDRKTDFIIANSWLDTDRITYHLPQGYKPEFLFQPVKIASKFGSYENELIFHDQQLIYHRTFKINDGRFPPEDYENYVAFLQEVTKADLARVVLVQE